MPLTVQTPAAKVKHPYTVTLDLFLSRTLSNGTLHWESRSYTASHGVSQVNDIGVPLGGVLLAGLTYSWSAEDDWRWPAQPDPITAVVKLIVPESDDLTMFDDRARARLSVMAGGYELLGNKNFNVVEASCEPHPQGALWTFDLVDDTQRFRLTPGELGMVALVGGTEPIPAGSPVDQLKALWPNRGPSTNPDTWISGGWPSYAHTSRGLHPILPPIERDPGGTPSAAPFWAILDQIAQPVTGFSVANADDMAQRKAALIARDWQRYILCPDPDVSVTTPKLQIAAVRQPYLGYDQLIAVSAHDVIRDALRWRHNPRGRVPPKAVYQLSGTLPAINDWAFELGENHEPPSGFTSYPEYRTITAADERMRHGIGEVVGLLAHRDRWSVLHQTSHNLEGVRVRCAQTANGVYWAWRWLRPTQAMPAVTLIRDIPARWNPTGKTWHAGHVNSAKLVIPPGGDWYIDLTFKPGISPPIAAAMPGLVDTVVTGRDNAASWDEAIRTWDTAPFGSWDALTQTDLR